MEFMLDNEPAALRRKLELQKMISAMLLFVIMVLALLLWDATDATARLEASFDSLQQTNSFWKSEYHEQKRVADRLTQRCSSR